MGAPPCPEALAAGLQVLHEDEAFLVLNKPSGLLAVPGRGEDGRHNLTSLAQARYPDALIVHRLDMTTSGILLLARGVEAQRKLSLAFEQRRISKRYEAVVEGHIAADEGRIDAPMIIDWPNRPLQVVDPVNGKPALTHWRVVERRADGTTHVELRPVTGRSHQLRVHLRHIGHPIRGDEWYAPHPLRARRLLLHATQIAFDHPTRGVPVLFRSPAPF